MFGSLTEKTAAVFEAFPCQPVNLPCRFSKIERTEQDGILTLENHFFQIAGYGQLRIAHTHAPKINIIAVFFFPEYCCQLPVYSMEFVMLGQKPIIALMDTVCLVEPMPISKATKSFMAKAHADYSEFNKLEELPQWFKECRSGDEFFYRPLDAKEFLRLGEIHLSLIKNLTKLFQAVKPFDEVHGNSHKVLLESYKKHHKINSPGIRLMNRSFGEDWTHEYLSAYLFG